MEGMDVEGIVAQIRSRMASRRTAGARGMPDPHAADLRRDQMTADLQTLQAIHDIARAPVVSHRPLVGGLLVALKRLLGALLSPFLGQQAVYNAANARFARDLADDVAALDRRLTALAQAGEEQGAALRWQLAGLGDEWRALLHAEMSAMHGQVADLQAQITALQGEVAAGQAEAAALRDALAAEARERHDVEDRVGRLVDSLLALKDRMFRAEESIRSGPPAIHNGGPDRAVNGHLDGEAFASQFRGSEEEIRERQRVYVGDFRGQAGEIVDLGCGRGEFLELLREAGVQARGIELDHSMASICRRKGLTVAEDEFFAHLSSLRDASLGGVFSAQVVEHLEPDDIVALVKLIHRKLEPGGVLALETVNPECLWTFAATFYIDLTHRRPVHAKALRFVLETAGFHDVEVRYLAPVDPSLHIPLLDESMLIERERERWNQSITTLNKLLFGFQEYAVIGRKR